MGPKGLKTSQNRNEGVSDPCFDMTLSFVKSKEQLEGFGPLFFCLYMCVQTFA